MDVCATELGVSELLDAYTQGSLSAVETVDAYLDRIAREDPDLGAYAAIFADASRHDARAADARRASGRPLPPLHAVPIAVKDLLDVAGCATTCGSMATSCDLAEHTASAVLRLEAAGAIVIGKTQLVEFAFGGWGTNRGLGTPRNPWDRTVRRTPGGSSSGSGVAVSARLAAAALGTDTGGSVRIPCALCGITGIKTTERLVTRAGMRFTSRTLDTIGPMARTAEDAARVLQAIHGPDARDPWTRRSPVRDYLAAADRGAHGLRIGPLPAADLAGVQPEIAVAFEAACSELAAAGAIVREPGSALEVLMRQRESGVIIAAEAYAEWGALVERDHGPGDAAARARVLAGRDIPAARYFRALENMRQARAEFVALFEQVDVLALPTLPCAAVPVEDVDEDDLTPSSLTRFVGFLGLCAIALPCGFTSSGLPISLQLVAAPFREDHLVALGAAYQRRTDYHTRRPPSPDAEHAAIP